MLSETETASGPLRLRDRHREQTRRDLSLAAFELASRHGLANVRVPQIAAATGVSTRTFNNYFSSKEAAIAWPAARRAALLATNLLERPPEEPLRAALVAAVMDRFGAQQPGLPANWLRDFRSLVASEPALLGEYLKASSAAEQALAEAIAQRMQIDDPELRPRLLAAMVVGAERAAVMHWMAMPEPRAPLSETMRAALELALSGVNDL